MLDRKRKEDKLFCQLRKHLELGHYKEVYNQLDRIGYRYNEHTQFLTDFSKVKGLHRYCYLLYALTRKETSEIYLTLCDELMYMSPFFDDYYFMIQKLYRKAFELFPEDVTLKEAIVSTFCQGHPDNPFEKEEMYRMAEDVLKVWPDHEFAKEYVKESISVRK